MFYDNFVKLCERKGIKPTRAAIESGIARSAVSNWKSNWENGIEVLPSNANVKALAAYFDVSVGYLLESEKEPDAVDGAELIKDELIGFYGEVKDELTQDDIDDLLQLMRIRAELNKSKKE